MRKGTDRWSTSEKISTDITQSSPTETPPRNSKTRLQTQS